MKGRAWNPAPARAHSADRRTRCESVEPPFNPFVADKVLTMCPEYTFRFLAVEGVFRGGSSPAPCPKIP